MAESQELFIAVRFPALNDFLSAVNGHRMGGAKMKKEWTNLVASYCMLCKLGHFTEPVRIDLIWYEPNYKRDQDNVAFAKKFIFDGLQVAGVITNDNYKWVKGFSDSFVYDGRSGVLIVMTEVIDESNNVASDDK